MTAPGRGAEAAAAVAGRLAPDRRARREGRSSRANMNDDYPFAARHQPAQQSVEQRLGSDHGRCLRWLRYEVRRLLACAPARLFGFSAGRRLSRLTKRHRSGFFHIG